jgi:Tfp pilus assembly protein PilN
MIQFNLLPDVKLEYAKTKRTKRTVILGSVAVTCLVVFIFVLLFLIVNVFQKQHISNLTQNIESKTNDLKSYSDLDKVLTVQNQLKALPGLHESKPATSRLTDYLVQLTPSEAKITDVTIDFDAGTMAINGTATKIEVVNQFADILKFTDYKEGEVTDKAFSEVVLPTFGVKGSDGRVTYGLQFKFKPEIFNNTKSVELVVPTIVSTRSVTEKPTDLFEQKQPEQLQGQ